MEGKIKVVELFAGVGGFRVGLEKASHKFDTIWANQWEPNSGPQHAFDVYNSHFKNSTNINQNISDVYQEVPQHDLLVGGFPCQDYSVAQGNKAQGLIGKKGVLWWEIHKILKKRNPKHVLLENVDRLLNSPVNNRGRDFAIMLRSLNDLGYIVEWKVINASDYGFPQKRKRVFIYAYKGSLPKNTILKKYVEENSLLESAFPSKYFSSFKEDNISKDIYDDLAMLTEKYGDGKFHHVGVAHKGKVFSMNYIPKYSGKKLVLKDILQSTPEGKRFLTEEQLEKARYQKEYKKLTRTTKGGHTYDYAEGSMSFPDNIEAPGRTMLTAEGSINRSSHYIKEKKGIRFITPIEAERLNGFPDNWTKGKTDRQRLFFMGNALVTGIVTKIGKKILERK